MGSRITLSLVSGAKISGTLSGPNLTLDSPADNPGQVGTMIELPMHQASTSTYEQELAALRHRVTPANAAD